MKYVKLVARRALSGLQLIEVAVCGTGLVAVTLLIFAQVLNRYWLGLPIIWLENLALHVFVWMIMLAMLVTTWREAHARVEITQEVLLAGKPLALSVHRLCMVIIAIVVTCVFLPLAYDFMLWGMKFPEYDTLVRWVNLGWARALLFVVFVLMVLHLLCIAIRETADLVRIWRSRSPEERSKSG